jgi:HK97 gp10 family phage protein
MEIPGMSKLMSQLEKLGNLDLEKIGMVGAYTLQSESIKTLTPQLSDKSTGNFINSANVEGIPNEGATLSFGTNYGIFIEYGSSKWSGHPFLRPTIDTKKNVILQKMMEQANKQIKEVK